MEFNFHAESAENAEFYFHAESAENAEFNFHAESAENAEFYFHAENAENAELALQSRRGSGMLPVVATRWEGPWRRHPAGSARRGREIPP